MAGNSKPVKPEVGQWYLDAESGDEFAVVDLDKDEGSVEIQYFDGTLSELSLEDWSGSAFSRAEAPEDWTGPVGAREEGDTGYDPESFELPPRHTPLPGYEQDEALRSDEAEAHERLPGSEAEE